MSAQIIDGKALAKQIRAQVKGEVAELVASGCTPTLASICVGENETTGVYVRQQQRMCERLGIEYLASQLPATSSERAVRTMIDSLNANPDIHGIIVQLPLPDGLDVTHIQQRIRPDKDVEGVHPENVGRLVNQTSKLAPCTGKAVMALIRSTERMLEGAVAVVVGAGRVAGKPISLLLQNEMCTTTVCDIATRELAFHTTRADILVVAVGKPGLITGDMIKPGAVVIDVGINTVDALDDAGRPVTDEQGRPKRRVVGDVADDAREVAGFLSPVPGGVGPMTVAMLMENIVHATRMGCAR